MNDHKLPFLLTLLTTICVICSTAHADQNHQPSLALNYYIAIMGDFPDGPSSTTLADVRPFADPAKVPPEYHLADGTLLPINQHQALFSLLGTIYGGDGRTSFALPDLRNRTPIGDGDGAALSNRRIGETGGTTKVNLTTAQLPSHTHINFLGETDANGSGEAHSNIQPFITLIPLIRVEGLYPTEHTICTGLENEGYLGEIKWFAGTFAPRGWAKADGSLLPIASYSALFTILQDTYGGDGETTFALPDLRGRAAVATGAGPGLTARAVGTKFGTETNTLTINQMPQHNHTLPEGASGNAGLNEAFNNMMPSLALHYMVCSSTKEVRLFAARDFIIGEPADGTNGNPDLRGRVPVGVSSTLTANTIFGSEVTNLTMFDLPVHTHSLPGEELDSGFNDWISQYYPDESDPAIVGYTAKPNGQIPNFLNYVLGRAPSTASEGILPKLSRDDTYVTFVYRENIYTAEHPVHLEYGSDLNNLQRARLGENGAEIYIEVNTAEPGLKIMTIKVPHRDAPQMFARLVVELPESSEPGEGEEEFPPDD